MIGLRFEERALRMTAMRNLWLHERGCRRELRIKTLVLVGTPESHELAYERTNLRCRSQDKKIEMEAPWAKQSS